MEKVDTGSPVTQPSTPVSEPASPKKGRVIYLGSSDSEDYSSGSESDPDADALDDYRVHVKQLAREFNYKKLKRAIEYFTIARDTTLEQEKQAESKRLKVSTDDVVETTQGAISEGTNEEVLVELPQDMDDDDFDTDDEIREQDLEHLITGYSSEFITIGLELFQKRMDTKFARKKK